MTEAERKQRYDELREDISFLVGDGYLDEASHGWLVVCLLEIRRMALACDPNVIKEIDELLEAVANEDGDKEEIEDEDEDEDEEEW
jgi:hypothetical protein